MDNINNSKATSKDVAKLAGVSQSTVSRVFLSNNKVSFKTKQKVLGAAKTLHYHPNAFARSLVSERSNIIGIVSEYTLNPSFKLMLSELVYLIQKSDKQVMYFEARNEQHVDDIMRKILQYQIEGVILLYANLSSKLTLECQARNIPVVQTLRYSTSGEKRSMVVPDNYKAAKVAAEHFIEKNFRHFGYVAGDVRSSSNMERQLGFFSALQERGFAEPVLAHGDYTYESGRRAMIELAKKVKFPCGVLCANDIMALGAIDALKYDLGLKIREDVGLVGFDNKFMSAWPSYSLTSFEVPIEAMARDALQILIENFNDRAMPPVVKKYDLELIERGSTK